MSWITGVAAAARRPRIATAAAILGVGVAWGTVVPAAIASDNNGPTKSTPVHIGAPFVGNWPGTTIAHGSRFTHWWLLPATVRPGDSVELAVDNSASNQTLHFCLVSPVDNFGAEQALAGCPRDSYVLSQRQDRLQMTYSGSSGQAHLVTSVSGGWDVGTKVQPAWDYGQYSVVIERIVTKVTPGLIVPAVVPVSFSVAASLVYGDNAPVADGVGARLEWRYRPERGSSPSPFTPLVDTFSAGGSAVFNANLPQEARGRAIQLRACAAQPGGTSAICTADQNTTVEAGPDPACVAAKSLRTKRARQVSRLKGKARRVKAKRAVVRGKRKRRVLTRRLRTTKRKIRPAKRRLAAARRGVRSSC